MTDNPAPLTDRLLGDDSLTFALTVITNRNNQTRDVIARRKEAFSTDVADHELAGLAWPNDVFSLSHVALPFPPDDPLYGSNPPGGDEPLHLGDIPIRGERDMNEIPGEWLLRMRYNPFYEVLETRVLEWLNSAGPAAR